MNARSVDRLRALMLFFRGSHFPWVRLTRAAEADLDEIVAYIEGEAGSRMAEPFAELLDAKLAELAMRGHGGVSRELVSPGLRLTVFGNYCIYFRLTDKATIVVRVLHGARHLEGR